MKKVLTAADTRRLLVEAFTASVTQLVERAVVEQVERFMTPRDRPARRARPAPASAPASRPRKRVATARAPAVPMVAPSEPRDLEATATPPTAKVFRSGASASRIRSTASAAGRPSGDVEAAAARILDHIQQRPGVLGEDARDALGLARGDWLAGVAKLALAGKLRKDGDRRAARYFVVSPEVFKAVPPILRRARTLPPVAASDAAPEPPTAAPHR